MKTLNRFLILAMLLSMVVPFPAAAAPQQAPAATAVITILHTNDFHGQLEEYQASSSNPGMARTAQVIEDARTTAGADNVLLLDAGDFMQGTLLSNIQQGVPTVDVYNYMGYDAITFGNHEFDWGMDVLADRVSEANFPFVSANVVTGTCTADNWTTPDFAVPYVLLDAGETGNEATIGVIGVTSLETPYITIPAATQGLCFKDPATSISHYYAEMFAAGADTIVVLSHLGFNDGGLGYGLDVYGDKTLAQRLINAGTPVPLIIGGHNHLDQTAATMIGSTAVVQAHYNGRKVGKAVLTIDTEANTASVAWERLVVNPATGAQNAAVQALINTYASDPDYQLIINEEIGYTNVPLTRDYNGDQMMGTFIQDAVLGNLNGDAITENDVEIVFNNPGGIRTDITGATYPHLITYGALFNVLPFGNQTITGEMTGAQIMDLLNQSATLAAGALQVGGLRYSFYRYNSGAPSYPTAATWAWGAMDVEVQDPDTGEWNELELDRVYKVATNEFLAPAGQDGFIPFKYFTNVAYWGDMLDQVNDYVKATYSTELTAYNGPTGDGTLDGRIERLGNNEAGPIVPITILHHNDSHGRLVKAGSNVGYTQLATLIDAERAKNPDRTLLLTAGDNFQGDSMMYYYKSAGLGYAADGTVLDPSMQINPLLAAFNYMEYDAMVLGNHEFNFGPEVFVGTLKDADFALLQANIADTGEYGLDQVDVEPYVSLSVGPEAIDVAILGIGNHRVPNYELPSNIPGLSFSNPIETAQDFGPDLAATHDAVIALTHIGFTEIPGSIETDTNVDTYLAANTTGINAVIGGHSHTDPSQQTAYSGAYKYLPTVLGNPDNAPVIVSQALRYNTYLGEVILGMRELPGGGYEVAASAGKAIKVNIGDVEQAGVVALAQPFVDQLATYNATVAGQTTQPIDTLLAFTQETNGANLQADASVWELESNGIEVDFHLSGAMTNRRIADGATPATPVDVTVADLFTAMPYENSLVVIEMNGPQLKAVLERAYRNYYYYNYVPGYGGYSYYTTCMLDTNFGGQISYRDTFPALPYGNNVIGLTFEGDSGQEAVDFTDADTYYRVSTVNYLAAGSCNFNNAGVSLFPIDQIVADSQLYVRDAVINYMMAQGVVSPMIEGRLDFQNFYAQYVGPAGATLDYSEDLLFQVEVPAGALTEDITLVYAPFAGLPQPSTLSFAGISFNLDSYVSNALQEGYTFELPVIVTLEYTDEMVAGLDEEMLGLYYWTGTDWEDAACGDYVRDLDANLLSVPICHLSEFALLTYEHSMTLSPAAAAQTGAPGTDVTYSLVISNTGNMADTYTFSASGNLWEVTLPEPLEVEPGVAYVVDVIVSIPEDAQAGDMDEVVVEAASSFAVDPVEATLTTTAGEVVAGMLETPEDALSGFVGTQVEYVLTLTNMGNLTDTFSITYTGNAWAVGLSEMEVELGAGESVEIIVLVDVPLDAADLDEDVVVVTVASETDPAMEAEATLTTTALMYKVFTPIIHHNTAP